MNDDEIRWITINGQHVPIHEGESKREAVSKFISSKKTRKNKVEEFKERKQSNNKIKKFVKKGNTFIPVRENENEKDVVKSYSRENDKERMNRIKDLQHNERLAQMGARQSLGAKGDREVAEAESRRGRLIKYTLENKDKIKKWADEYDDERNQRAYEKTKRGEGLTKEEYFGFLARGPKEGDIILAGGENGEDVRVGKNGKLERIDDSNYRDNVYVGKQEKIKNYVEKKKSNNKVATEIKDNKAIRNENAQLKKYNEYNKNEEQYREKISREIAKELNASLKNASENRLEKEAGNIRSYVDGEVLEKGEKPYSNIYGGLERSTKSLEEWLKRLRKGK